MSYPLTDKDKAVIKMADFALTGNIVPQTWTKTIASETGKPLSNAILILADIVYWYRPAEIRDEQSGAVIEHRKKFAADKLQRNYGEWADLFGWSKKQAADAIKHLERIGVIDKETRTITVRGQRLNNVLYIGLNVEKLRVLTYPNGVVEGAAEKVVPPLLQKSNGALPKGHDPYDKKVTARDEKGMTNTKTTAKTTQDLASAQNGKSEEKPKAPKKTMPRGVQVEYVEALEQVSGIDRASESNYGYLTRFGKELLAMGKTPEDVKRIFGEGGVWYREDFRGKKGEKPSPPLIVREIKNLSEVDNPVSRDERFRLEHPEIFGG